MKIFYPGQQGGAFGWGVFGENIVREFKKLGAWTDDPRDADCIFQPLADQNFTPTFPLSDGRNLAMSFFEFPLGPDAAANAAKFDLCFVGSSWCRERCREAGILNTRVLLQGVDSAIFSPQPPRAPDGAIRIFSGGKFEYRKGQDLVIAAFREFVKSHPEAHLVCAWHNPWPQLFRTMANSGVINTLAHGETQPEFFRSLLHNNGISDSQFTILPQLSQHDLAREMANTDFGLFPNRCEGGTNLVLMEYAALGREIVANVLTGHADVENAISMPIEATEDENHWALQPVANITDAMRDAADYPRSDFAGCSWTWEDAAKTVLLEIDKLSVA